MVSLITLVIFLFWYRSAKKNGTSMDRKYMYVILAAECLGLVLSAGTMAGELTGENTLQSLTRPSIGEGNKTYSIVGESNGQEETYDISVSEEAVSEDEAREIAELAMQEIDETFLGNNPSAEEVTEAIVMKDVYQNGKVTAEWEINAFGVVDSDGTVHPEKIDEPQTASATAYLKVQEYTYTYQMNYQICPYSEDSPQGRQAALQEAVQQSDDETKNESEMLLPTKIGDTSVVWYLPKDRTGEWISILGIFLGFGLILGKYRDEQKRENDRQQRLERDYPQIVSELSLYIGAGIPAKSAFMRMAQSYEQGKEAGRKEKEGYEEVVILCHRMQDGEGEKAAYEHFAARCSNRYYRKLTLLLTQNLRQGNAKMTELLEQEELSAAELQRTQALARGEVASTKLLIPLVGLLGIILVLIGMPAFFMFV